MLEGGCEDRKWFSQCFWREEGEGGEVVEEKGKEGVCGKKERAGRQVGCPCMFEHSRDKALLEFKVKNPPTPTPPPTPVGR